jgi:KaiC/GvpD/RAD55 family RecA-like ATPase
MEGLIINNLKKNISRKDFDLLLLSEKVAYEIYHSMVKEKSTKEYVDIIATTYTNEDVHSSELVEYMVRAKEILKKDYGVDMMELQFQYQENKEAINKYILHNCDAISDVESMDIKI